MSAQRAVIGLCICILISYDGQHELFFVEIRSGVPPAPKVARPSVAVRRRGATPLPERAAAHRADLAAGHLLHQARRVQVSPHPHTHSTQDLPKRFCDIFHEVT